MLEVLQQRLWDEHGRHPRLLGLGCSRPASAPEMLTRWSRLHRGCAAMLPVSGITDVDTVLRILVSEVDGITWLEALSRRVASQKNLLWRSGVLIKMLKKQAPVRTCCLRKHHNLKEVRLRVIVQMDGCSGLFTLEWMVKGMEKVQGGSSKDLNG